MVFILTLVSMAIWVAVSREAMRESKDKENTSKMLTLLAVGSLTTIILVFSLYDKL